MDRIFVAKIISVNPSDAPVALNAKLNSTSSTVRDVYQQQQQNKCNKEARLPTQKKRVKPRGCEKRFNPKTRKQSDDTNRQEDTKGDQIKAASFFLS